MSVQPFVLRPDQHEPALNVVGTQVTVLVSNAATKSYGITLQQGAEGTGPPPHSHDWDEAFYILKGVTHFLCDRKVYDCNAGTFVHVPPGNRAWLPLRKWRWSDARDYEAWRVSGSDVHGHRQRDFPRTAGCSKAP